MSTQTVTPIANSVNAEIGHVLHWLEKMSDRGVLPQSSSRLQAVALRRLTSVLSEEEPTTARWVYDNLDGIAARLANLADSKPATVRTYMVRARGALEDFFRYQEDPVNFKPKSGRRSRKKDEDNGTKPAPKKTKSPRTPKATSSETVTTPAQPAQADLPFTSPTGRRMRDYPLGRGEDDALRTFYYSLPERFSVADVQRVARHLMTMAEDWDPSPVVTPSYGGGALSDE